MGGLLLIAAAFAGECDLEAPLQLAESKLLTLDMDGADAALGEAKSAFGCGDTSSSSIARYWLLVAGHAQLQGDEERLDEALIAARAASEEIFIDALGQPLRERWLLVTAAPGASTVLLTDLPDGYVVRVDGHEVDDVVLTPGLHVLQALGGDFGWGRVIRAGSGDTIRLSTDLPPLPEEPVLPPPPEEPPPKPPSDGAVGFVVVGGVGANFGKEVGAEPAAKIGPSLEVGARVALGDAAWVRGLVGGTFLVGGAWSWTPEGSAEERTWPIGWGASASGGLVVGETDLGVLAGAFLPGRIQTRALVSLPVGPVHLEPRLGLDIGTPLSEGAGPRLEPAGSAHVSIHL